MSSMHTETLIMLIKKIDTCGHLVECLGGVAHAELADINSGRRRGYEGWEGCVGVRGASRRLPHYHPLPWLGGSVSAMCARQIRNAGIMRRKASELHVGGT